MILKAVSLFLIGILLLGMFGKLHLVGIGRKKDRKRLGSTKCKKCGSPIPGKGPCACQSKGKS